MFFKNNHKKDDNLKNSGNKFRSVFPKIVSVVAALVLWFYVYDTRSVIEEKVFTNVPIKFENFDRSTGLEIVSGKEHSIDVTLSGSKEELSKITKDDIIATADMNGVNSPDDSVTLKINISAPKGVDIVEKSASQVSVKVDKSITKTIDVAVDLNYDKIDASQYEIKNYELSVDAVQVTGPVDDVENISKLSAPITTGEIKSTFKSNVALVPVDESGNPIDSTYVTLSNQSVTVTVNVNKLKTVPLKADFYNDEYEYDYSLNPAEVKIKGDSALVDSITSIKTLKIDTTEANVTDMVELQKINGIEIFNVYEQKIDKVEYTIHSVTEKDTKTVAEPVTTEVDKDLAASEDIADA